jgi:hypothetical protein
VLSSRCLLPVNLNAGSVLSIYRFRFTSAVQNTFSGNATLSSLQNLDSQGTSPSVDFRDSQQLIFVAVGWVAGTSANTFVVCPATFHRQQGYNLPFSKANHDTERVSQAICSSGPVASNEGRTTRTGLPLLPTPRLMLMFSLQYFPCKLPALSTCYCL